VRGELGRGGRYDAPRMDGGGESAAGFTLYMDTVLRALPAPASARRLYLPADTEPRRARALRADGWVTIAGLDEAEPPHEAARRYGCGHLLLDGVIVDRKD
jgi:ATP phosphoribosyltransferase regulatory subunit